MTTWRPAPCPLPTRWTALVDPVAPLPEYPRPQLVRATWQSLNGVYDCAVRPVREPRPAHFDHRILVPFPIESALSGVGLRVTGADRIWYRRTFRAPAAPLGHRWMLRFGAVDWRADVWLDGKILGSHEGGFDPFAFDVGTLGGEHELVVAAWDPTDGGPQPRGKQALTPPYLMRPFFYTPASGIWQTVWIELVPDTHIGSLRLTPDGDGVVVAAQLVNPVGGERLHWRVHTAVDGVVASVEHDGSGPARIFVPSPRRWSPSDPFLYDVEVEVRRDDVAVDQVASYFGLRDIRIACDAAGVRRFFLNGSPIVPHGLLDQGYWPDGIYTAPTDEALRFDLQETKRLGFNLVRKHVKVEPARWYYHCDRLGLLVFQDMPNGDRMTLGVPIGGVGAIDPTRWLGRREIRRTRDSAQVFERELEAMLRCLGNHPSIVMWVPFNEGWGQFEARRIAKWLRWLDPSRLVDAASGWVDPGNGDVRDVHVYHPGPRMPSRRDAKRAEVLGEWGGLGLDVPGHRWPRKPFAYRILPTATELSRRYRQQLEELVRLVKRGLSAAVWTQTTDVEGEVNGLFTYDREVLKLDADWLRAANREVIEAGNG